MNIYIQTFEMCLKLNSEEKQQTKGFYQRSRSFKNKNNKLERNSENKLIMTKTESKELENGKMEEFETIRRAVI